MNDLANHPLVREQKTFEQRLAAAVLIHAQEDFMLFEEATPAKDKHARRDRKRKTQAQAGADRFFDNGTREGVLRSPWLSFWTDVLTFGKGRRPERGDYRHLLEERRQRYEAAVLKRTVGRSLQGFDDAVVVEAYRRTVETYWRKFYAERCVGSPRALTKRETEYWKGLFRASLTSEDVLQEAKDVQFEIENGLFQVAA